VDYNQGYINPEGATGTFGECKCRHKWRFKCLQITGLFIEEE